MPGPFGPQAKMKREMYDKMYCHILCEIPDRLMSSLSDLEMMESTLVELLEEVRTKKEILKKAVDDYGTP